MPDGERNGRGPTWAWIVGVLSMIVGAGFAAWMGIVWSQMTEMTHDLESINQTLVELKAQDASQAQIVTHDSDQIVKLWEKVSADHEILMQDQYKLTIDDDWIKAQVHANRAIRELHGR